MGHPCLLPNSGHRKPDYTRADRMLKNPLCHAGRKRSISCLIRSKGLRSFVRPGGRSGDFISRVLCLVGASPPGSGGEARVRALRRYERRANDYGGHVAPGPPPRSRWPVPRSGNERRAGLGEAPDPCLCQKGARRVFRPGVEATKGARILPAPPWLLENETGENSETGENGFPTH